MKYFLFTGGFAIALLAACHPSKKVSQTPAPQSIDSSSVPPPVSTGSDSAAFIKTIYNAIQSNKIVYNTFSGKIEVDFSDGSKKVNANAHVRMQKDSLIWLSVTGPLGIEGLRLLISADSVKILDKQNKIYRARGISFLEEVTALPLDLATLQDLLIGNPIYFSSEILNYSKVDGKISLSHKGDYFHHLLLVSATDQSIESSNLRDIANSSRSALITYADYERQKGNLFPQKRSITVIDTVEMNIKLDYKQYEFNEKLSFPFSIPKNYDHN